VALLEAMACGLPVVATAVPGVDEILAGGEDSGGIVVPPGRPDAIAGALARLVTDASLARTLGTRARRRAAERFSLEAVGAQLATMLASRGR
jgi:glycosyltransferase involved in cell wall biosynthesis